MSHPLMAVPCVLLLCPPAPLIPSFVWRGSGDVSMLMSHSHRSTTPGTLSNKTTQNSLGKRPLDNTE